MKEILRNNKKYLVSAPALKVIEAVFELFIPLILASILNKGIVENNTTHIVIMLVLLTILYLVGFITSAISQLQAAVVSQNVAHELRSKVLSKVLLLNSREHDKASLNNRLMTDVNQVGTGINIGIRLGLRAPTLMIGSVIMSLFINPKITLYFLITCILTFTFLYILSMKIAEKNHKVLTATDKFFSYLSNLMFGLRHIKGSNKVSEESKKLRQKNKEYYHLNRDLEILNSLLNPGSFLIIQ